jgi:hypothetical protein
MMAIRQDLPSLMGLMASARKYPELKLWAIFFENPRVFDANRRFPNAERSIPDLKCSLSNMECGFPNLECSISY